MRPVGHAGSVTDPTLGFAGGCCISFVSPSPNRNHPRFVKSVIVFWRLWPTEEVEKQLMTLQSRDCGCVWGHRCDAVDRARLAVEAGAGENLGFALSPVVTAGQITSHVFYSSGVGTLGLPFQANKLRFPNTGVRQMPTPRGRPSEAVPPSLTGRNPESTSWALPLWLSCVAPGGPVPEGVDPPRSVRCRTAPLGAPSKLSTSPVTCGICPESAMTSFTACRFWGAVGPETWLPFRI